MKDDAFKYYESIRETRLKEVDDVKKTTESILALCMEHWDDILYSIKDSNGNKHDLILKEFTKQFGEFDVKVISKEIIKHGVHPEKHYEMLTAFAVIFALVSFANMCLVMIGSINHIDFDVIEYVLDVS